MSLEMQPSENYGRFWGTLNIRCRIILGIQKGIIILITTHGILITTHGQVHDLGFRVYGSEFRIQALGFRFRV